MTTVAEILAIIFIIVGTGFSVIGVIGFKRLPDVYTRLHATGKVGVLGVVLLLVAAALVTPLAWGKALILILLLLAIGPVTAHVLSSTAVRLNIPMAESEQNDLEHIVEK